MFSREHVERRNDAVFQNFLLVINVVQKKIQRRDPLHESAFEKLPFLRRNDARHQIKGEDFLGACRVSINVEGYSLAQKSEINRLALVFEFSCGQALE